jgi:hypothetical protein
MPPPAARTIKDLIFWQYAKIIADSAKVKNYRFVMDRFKKLQSGEIEWSGSIREYVRERESKNTCIYCGSTENLSVDHLIPRVRGGPDSGDNVVESCKSCNSSKGGKCLYEWWFESASNAKLSKLDRPPRIAEGKYLKLHYQLHEKNETLDVTKSDLSPLCDGCVVGHLCEDTKLTVYCLESILWRRS